MEERRCENCEHYQSCYRWCDKLRLQVKEESRCPDWKKKANN